MRISIVGSSLKTKNPCIRNVGRPPTPGTSQPVLKSCGLCLLRFQIPCSPFSWLRFLATAFQCCLHFGEGLDHHKLNRFLSLSSFKKPPVCPHHHVAKVETSSQPFQGAISAQLSLPQHTFDSHTPCASK